MKNSYDRPRKIRHAPNFYAIGKIAGYVVMFIIGYFVTIALRLIFNI